MHRSVGEVFLLNYVVFQHDNYSIHTYTIAQNLNITVLTWPSKSRNINTIENVWGLMVKKLRREIFWPKNRQDLRNVIIDGWYNSKVEYCQTLINLLPRRLQLVIEKTSYD